MTAAHHAPDRPARPYGAKNGDPASGGPSMKQAQPWKDHGCNRVTAE